MTMVVRAMALPFSMCVPRGATVTRQHERGSWRSSSAARSQLMLLLFSPLLVTGPGVVAIVRRVAAVGSSLAGVARIGPRAGAVLFLRRSDCCVPASASYEFVAEDLCESLLSLLRDVSSIAACFDHVHRGDARESGLSIVHDNH